MKSKKLSEKILRLIKSKGFSNIVLDPVLETKHILQRSGENFRKFMFSFYDLNGKELCLRPDLTISSVLRYVQNKFNKKKKVCYSGEAYRKKYNNTDAIFHDQSNNPWSNTNLLPEEELVLLQKKLKLEKI